MSKELKIMKTGNSIKNYKIDFDKVSSIDDVKDILKTLDLIFTDHGYPEKLQSIQRFLVPYAPPSIEFKDGNFTEVK